LYLSQKPDIPLYDADGKKVIILGIVVTIFSFVNIPLGFGNPPYSIGDFSIFLAGIGLILVGLFRIRSYILPLALPLIAVIGFQVYDHFLRNEDLIVAPLIPPVVFVTQFLLNSVGIPAQTAGNLIWYNSLQGAPITISIVSDCTGIWSLGTFTIASLIVITSFPQSKSLKGFFLILIGYCGTYVANLMRVFIIALSGYFFGPVGVIEQTHVHIGWIVFTLWMGIFWYYFFTRFLGLSVLPLKKQ
jgi:exosortase/archaeosortase family protein